MRTPPVLDELTIEERIVAATVLVGTGQHAGGGTVVVAAAVPAATPAPAPTPSGRCGFNFICVWHFET